MGRKLQATPGAGWMGWGWDGVDGAGYVIARDGAACACRLQPMQSMPMGTNSFYARERRARVRLSPQSLEDVRHHTTQEASENPRRPDGEENKGRAEGEPETQIMKLGLPISRPRCLTLSSAYAASGLAGVRP